MKYCIDYFKQSSILNEVDEIIIKYNYKDTSLPTFLEKYKEKRIIISIEDVEDFINRKEVIKINSLYQSGYNNIVIRFDKYNEDLKETLKNLIIPFFFNIYCGDWDTFLGLINLKVSDIYIAEDLGFELDLVAEIAHENNIQLRVFPNVAQSKWKETPALKKFFIRPEDTEKYEQYIDVYEFFGKRERIETFYKIYKKDKKWFGKLNEIIIGFNSDLDNKYVIPRFADCRMVCGKRCLKKGKCQMCERIEELSHTLEETKLIVRIDKDK